MEEYCPICKGKMKEVEYKQHKGRCSKCALIYSPEKYPCPWGGTCDCCTHPNCFFRIVPFDNSIYDENGILWTHIDCEQRGYHTFGRREDYTWICDDCGYYTYDYCEKNRNDVSMRRMGY